MEGRVLRRSGVENPHADTLVRLDPDRVVLVLVGVAVEHDGVGLYGLHLGEIAGLVLGAEVELTLDERVLVVDAARGSAGR